MMSKKYTVLITIFMVLPLLTTNGYDKKLKYVYYQKGNCSILLTAPHAGSPRNLIPGIPMRNSNVRKFNNKWDTNTGKITMLVAEMLKTKFNVKPYVVIALFSRKQIDANRRPAYAYQNSRAGFYYNFYHNKIKSYVKNIRNNFGNGILLDIHGVSKKHFLIWRGSGKGKTMRKLINRHGWKSIYGKNGLFYNLKKYGYGVFPKTRYGSERPYNGGYTVRKYGSHRANGIDAIQLEISKEYRFKKNNYLRLSKYLAYSIYKFYKTYIIR